jgi:hypothetical protein
MGGLYITCQGRASESKHRSICTQSVQVAKRRRNWRWRAGFGAYHKRK